MLPNVIEIIQAIAQVPTLIAENRKLQAQVKKMEDHQIQMAITFGEVMTNIENLAQHAASRADAMGEEATRLHDRFQSAESAIQLTREGIARDIAEMGGAHDVTERLDRVEKWIDEAGPASDLVTDDNFDDKFEEAADEAKYISKDDFDPDSMPDLEDMERDIEELKEAQADPKEAMANMFIKMAEYLRQEA